MKGFKMYNQIQQLKELGFKKAGVAKQLMINRETVSRYWNMTSEEFESELARVKKLSTLSNREEIILNWLRQYPTMTAAQVCDWLKESYKEFNSERIVSRYVKQLREQYHLLKSNHPREYEAVEDLPMGQQMQLDFGEYSMTNTNKGRTKVYFAGFVLAHSRFKWGYLQNRPFTSVDLVNACSKCFSFIGGMPNELVVDQDSLISVNENYGDIIYTYEFEKFRQDCGLKMYLCRKSDPESKGKIESVVKFIKYNFLANRLFVDEEILNSSFSDWLERTGNGKVHSTTKKIPAEVFKSERDYLRPFVDSHINTSTDIFRNVRKDNTILYDSSRYSVPFGTYTNHPEVRVKVENGRLIISDVFADFVMCEHPISADRGRLVKNTNHRRDRESSIDAMEVSLNNELSNLVVDFIKEIRKQKARYSRDQFSLIHELIKVHGKDSVLSAIDYCVKNRLYSATYVNDYLIHLNQLKPELPTIKIPVSDKKYHITTEKRSVSEYAKAGGQ